MKRNVNVNRKRITSKQSQRKKKNVYTKRRHKTLRTVSVFRQCKYSKQLRKKKKKKNSNWNIWIWKWQGITFTTRLSCLSLTFQRLVSSECVHNASHKLVVLRSSECLSIIWYTKYLWLDFVLSHDRIKLWLDSKCLCFFFFIFAMETISS